VEYDPCVGCGFCCLEAPCVAASYYNWIEEGRCSKLKWDEEAGRYWCLQAKENRPFAITIYVGEGCTSNLNTWRKEVKNRG